MPKIYSAEFKDLVVELYERGHSVNETITEYGISESSLFEWKKAYDKRNPDYIGDVLKRRDGYKRADYEKKLEEIIAVMNITRCKPSASISENMVMIKALVVFLRNHSQQAYFAYWLIYMRKVLLNFQHPVTDTDMGLDVLGILILLDLLSQGGHMYPQGCHIALPGTAPNLIGQIGVGQHLA